MRSVVYPSTRYADQVMQFTRNMRANACNPHHMALPGTRLARALFVLIKQVIQDALKALLIGAKPQCIKLMEENTLDVIKYI